MFLRHLRKASTLVVAEHSNGKLSSATLNTISAAVKLQQPITVLLTLSKEEDAVISELQQLPIAAVIQSIHSSYEHKIAENLIPLYSKLQQLHSYSHWLFNSTSEGRNLIGRLAGTLDTSVISDILEIKSTDTFKRGIYAGNAISTVQSNDKVKLMTVRSTAFAPAEFTENRKDTIKVTTIEPVVPSKGKRIFYFLVLTEFVKMEASCSEMPELSSAKIVISGGRGLKSADNFGMLNSLAKKLNAAVGASRAAVDAGYAPNDLQVGQTGKVVAPALYIAVGISGAIQHIAGMKDSKCIVAINKDPDAPIFQIADYGLVADLFKAVPELTEKVK